jgi:hypothetical protein
MSINEEPGCLPRPKAWLAANATLLGKDMMLQLLLKIQEYEDWDIRSAVISHPEFLASFKEKHLLQSYRAIELEAEFSKLSGYDL